MWTTFDNGQAWTLILTNSNILGFDFEKELTTLKDKTEEFGNAVNAANAALLALDGAIARVDVTPACLEAAKALVQQRDNLASWL